MQQNKYNTHSASRANPQTPAEKKPRRLRWGKPLATLCTVAALLLCIVGGTLAYLASQSGPVENTFNPSEVTCEVQNDKSVKNTSDIDAYIRAKVVVTWADSNESESGVTTVYPGTPQYTVSGTDWVQKDDGFLYYTKRVSVGGSTTPLVVDSTAPNGYEVKIEILADAIQADGVTSSGTKAVEDAWGVDSDIFSN